MQDGLVSVIADDINGIQDAVNGNIAKRLKMVLSGYGLKASTDEKFELEYRHISGDIFEITCSGLGLVVFGDYIIVSGGQSAIDVNATVINEGYVYLVKTLSYSNDQTGNYKPGHPVDSDGNLLPSGYNVESEDVLALAFTETTAVELKDSVLLAKVTRGEKNTLDFEDLRMENALSLKDIGLYEACDDKISDFTIDSVYQTQLLNQDIIEDANTNVLSSRNNLSVARVYAMFTWTELDNVFAYETRLQIYNNEGQKVGYPRSEIVASGLSGTVMTIFLEITEGVLYDASIRVLSNSPSHTPGPWITKQFIGGAYSGLSEENPIPTPTITTEAIQGVEETYTPLLIEITINPADGTPQPARVQIFQTSDPVLEYTGIKGRLIYEGPTIPFRYLVPAGGTKYFLGRVVGPGGLCSNTVFSPEGYTASNNFPEYVPQDICLNIPIAVAVGDANKPDMPVRAFSFFPPREGAKLRSIYFQGAGCMVYSSADCPDLVAEIVIGNQDTDFVVPTSPNATGKYALDCDTKVVFGSSSNEDFDYNLQMPRIASTGEMPETAGNYTRVRAMATVSNPPEWDYDEEISVWVTACNWVSGTNLRFAFAGNLILVFESIKMSGLAV